MPAVLLFFSGVAVWVYQTLRDARNEMRVPGCEMEETRYEMRDMSRGMGGTRSEMRDTSRGI
ncbi:hypothetical protein AYO43_09675 [Nitrospira sp. SCGC AG-212-E16]|nr:hypothetical protein AYO43_09675 [Nitrospira sp. SCGC AG-212-E16]